MDRDLMDRDVGCTSLGAFSSRFTEIVGQTPSEYRARDHRAAQVLRSYVSRLRMCPPQRRRLPA